MSVARTALGDSCERDADGENSLIQASTAVVDVGTGGVDPLPREAADTERTDE